MSLPTSLVSIDVILFTGLAGESLEVPLAEPFPGIADGAFAIKALDLLSTLGCF